LPSPHDPIAFSPGGLTVRWYAIFILCGIIAAILFVRWLAIRRGMDPTFLLDVAPWVVLGAIVGARGYYILLKFGYYIHHPYDAIDVREGGLTIHGALVVGAAMVAFFCWRYGQRFFTWTDLIIPGVALGQAIGRWGNWANQEAFGTPTRHFWGVAIDPARRPAQYAQFTHFQPTFLYESVLDLATALVLAWLVLRQPRRRWLREGDVLWLYCVVYGTVRFVIERIRTDSLDIGPYPAAYWLSWALILVGATMLVVRHTVWPAPHVPPPAATAGGGAGDLAPAAEAARGGA